MSTQRVLRNSRAELSVTLYVGETATDSSTPVTIEVVDDRGTEIVAAGTATDAGSAGDGTYTYALSPALIPDVALLTARWTATLDGVVQVFETHAEVTGGHYFSLAELRDTQGLRDNEVAYPTAQLARARLAAEVLFENATGVAWVPRYRRVVFDGAGSPEFLVPDLYPREVLGAWLDGVAIAGSPDWHTYSEGRIVRDDLVPLPIGHRNIEVAYEHGRDAPPPILAEKAVDYARTLVLRYKGAIPDRAIQLSTEAGSFTLGTASERRPTGYPEIDAVLAGHDHRVPGVA